MAYLMYSISFLALVVGTILYLLRRFWLPYVPLPSPGSQYTRIPTTFLSDVEAGFHSTSFNLGDNITSGDNRRGLDDEGKKAVAKIMRKKKVGFDEARRLYMEDRFKKNGIGADGLPKDPKFISFS